MAEVCAVLDANIFLEYQSLENIPWLDLLDADEVTLLVPYAAVEELDRYKSEGSTSRKQDRARKGLKAIQEAATAGGSLNTLPDTVRLKYTEDPADFDYHAHGLDKDLNDDRIVATALHFKESKDCGVVLITGDVGPQLKGGARGLDTLSLSEYRTEALSPEEKEARKLEQQLQEYKSAAPDLNVVLANGVRPKRYEAQIAPESDLDEDELEEELARLRDEYPEVQPNTTAFQGALNTAMIPESEYDRYNKKRQEYFDSHEIYLRLEHKVENFKRRAERLFVAIENRGKAPARNIEVILEIPDGPLVIADSDVPKGHNEPKPPRRPRPFPEIISAAMDMSFSPPDLSPLTEMDFRPSNTTDWQIEEKNSYHLVANINYIRQQRTESLNPFWIYYPPDSEASSFTIPCRIVADEIPGELSDELHFVVRSQRG